jgi:putative membrane protein
MMYGGFQSFGQGPGREFLMYGHLGWLEFLPFIFNIIFYIILITLAVIFLRKYGAKVREQQKFNDPALRVLRERYAHGEIDSEEFQRRRHDLEIRT